MNPAVLSSETSLLTTFLASFLIWVMFGGVAFLWVIDGRVKKEQALHAIMATIVAWASSMMLKSLLPVTRPFIMNGVDPLTLTIPSQHSSFPSTHSSVAFALATSVWLHDKKLGTKFLIMAILVAAGRVMSNVHTATDVVAGLIVGIVTAYITKKLHAHKLI